MRGAKLGMCDLSIASIIYEIPNKASNSFDKTLTIPTSQLYQRHCNSIYHQNWISHKFSQMWTQFFTKILKCPIRNPSCCLNKFSM
jgi:hypothetical protein